MSEMLCIGHRGAMGYSPENTLASIRKALELGVPCIEVDVYLVEDHLVVFHDDRLERTTNGKGYLIEKPFDYVRSLDAGRGERIPTLEEVCKEIYLKAGINIELKGIGTSAPVVQFIADLLRGGWDKDQILISSFNHRMLLEVKRLNADLLLGALICGLPIEDAKFACDLGVYSVHLSLEFVDLRFVEDAHSRGLNVFVYTVNHEDDIEKMEQLGVDGVFTNYPDRVLKRQNKSDITRGFKGWPRRGQH